MAPKRARRNSRASRGTHVESSLSQAPLAEADIGADARAPSQTAGQLGRPSGQASQSEGFSTLLDVEDDPDHVKILLATDNHVGYMERDPVRGQDSINTFREILQIGKDNDVDFILLGGDLFHENRPSRTTMHQVMGALREFTLGDRPVSVELLSDPKDGQAEGYNFPAINYEDSNLNVAIPVFSIHGNHDDPQGVGAEGALSAVDLLSVTGLINYFGKVELPAADAVARKGASQAPAKGGLSDVGIRIRPVLLQKGRTKIALYGMGNIKDERMHFELRTNRVRMYRPAENPDEWFNILTLHQNRAAHDPKAVVPETMFDDSIHLVVWGHEHEQLIRPQPVAGKRYHISQPGSSVATSLCPGEAAEKQVAIIHVKERDFHLEQIPLKTVRPFVMEDIDLDQAVEEARLQIDDKQGVTKLLKSKVKELVERANHEQLQKCASTSEDQRPDQMLPLVRLRVYYTRHEMGNLVRFGQDLVGKVANPRDLLQFSKKKGGAFDRKNANLSKTYLEPTDEMLSAEKLEKVRMSDLVQTYLATQSLHILDPHGLERSVMQFVDKDDRDAISQFVKKELRLTNAGLVTADPDERALEAELDRIREQKNRVVDEATTKGIDTEHSDAAHERGATQARSARRHGSLDDSMDSDDSMMDDIFGDKDVPAPTQRAQAKNRGRTTTNRSGRQVVSGTATPSSSRRYGGTQAMLTFRGDSEDEEDQTRTSRPRPTLSSRAAALAAPAKKGNARNKPTPTPTPTSKRAAALASTSKATTSRTTGTRAAARKASSRFVETQAPGDGDEEEAEAFVVDDEDDDFED